MTEHKRVVPLTSEQEERLHELVGEDLVLPPAVVDEIARIAGYDSSESAEKAGLRLGVSLDWRNVLVWGEEPEQQESQEVPQ